MPGFPTALAKVSVPPGPPPPLARCTVHSFVAAEARPAAVSDKAPAVALRAVVPPRVCLIIRWGSGRQYNAYLSATLSYNTSPMMN